jgi:parvulin-like peptidyl-prolyl isomerase|tara:strand:- start:2034 stop:2978 length:945 start_codon:yes stop_codon:yes gene_type:complete
VIKIKKIILGTIILLICSQYSYGVIKDSLYATVGNKAITSSDIMNEIKTILILNNKPFSADEKQQLEAAAIQSAIQRNIKQIEIDKHPNLSFSNLDLNNQLNILAKNINMSMEVFKETFQRNNVNFSIVKNRITTELLWNSLIFQIYKNNLIIDENEIIEQLSFIKTKKNIDEFLLSEIIIKIEEKNMIESKIKKIKEKIEIEGFEKVAMSSSISGSAERGGDLGWVSENVIANNLKTAIFNTPVGELSKAILLPDGILIFKVKDKRSVKTEMDIEKVKDQLVNNEKEKLLKMYSMSHYDKLRRSVSIDYYMKK